MPGRHAGKELANAALKTGFRSRARVAVFLATDGSGALDRREHDYDIPPEWWWPSVGDHPRGLQVLNLTKGEGWAILNISGYDQRVELVGISFRRIDLAAHFQISPAVHPVEKLPAKRGAKPKYDWAQFQSHAQDRLDHHGGFLGIDWRQSDLEREMTDWCTAHWGLSPGESTIRTQVVKASAEYEARKAGQ